MKQRAALIRTLALNPTPLLLDEPFSALDYQTRLMVSADICRLIRAAGKTIIITHDLSEAISLADKVIVLSARPAVVKTQLPIRLTLLDDTLLAARNAPEFKQYFNTLWEEQPMKAWKNSGKKRGLTKQEEYVKSHRKNHHVIASWRFLFLLFLILWETGANLGWIDSFFFSSPSRVVFLFLKRCQDRSIFLHVGITLWETLLSFLLVFMFSLICATLLWYSTKLSEILEPYLVILNSLPKSALAPLFIVWLGPEQKPLL